MDGAATPRKKGEREGCSRVEIVVREGYVAALSHRRQLLLVNETRVIADQY